MVYVVWVRFQQLKSARIIELYADSESFLWIAPFLSALKDLLNENPVPENNIDHEIQLSELQV